MVGPPHRKPFADRALPPVPPARAADGEAEPLSSPPSSTSAARTPDAHPFGLLELRASALEPHLKLPDWDLVFGNAPGSPAPGPRPPDAHPQSSAPRPAKTVASRGASSFHPLVSAADGDSMQKGYARPVVTAKAKEAVSQMHTIKAGDMTGDAAHSDIGSSLGYSDMLSSLWKRGRRESLKIVKRGPKRVPVPAFLDKLGQSGSLLSPGGRSESEASIPPMSPSTRPSSGLCSPVDATAQFAQTNAKSAVSYPGDKAAGASAKPNTEASSDQLLSLKETNASPPLSSLLRAGFSFLERDEDDDDAAANSLPSSTTPSLSLAAAPDTSVAESRPLSQVATEASSRSSVLSAVESCSSSTSHSGLSQATTPSEGGSSHSRQSSGHHLAPIITEKPVDHDDIASPRNVSPNTLARYDAEAAAVALSLYARVEPERKMSEEQEELRDSSDTLQGRSSREGRRSPSPQHREAVPRSAILKPARMLPTPAPPQRAGVLAPARASLHSRDAQLRARTAGHFPHLHTTPGGVHLSKYVKQQRHQHHQQQRLAASRRRSTSLPDIPEAAADSVVLRRSNSFEDKQRRSDATVTATSAPCSLMSISAAAVSLLSLPAAEAQAHVHADQDADGSPRAVSRASSASRSASSASRRSGHPSSEASHGESSSAEDDSTSSSSHKIARSRTPSDGSSSGPPSTGPRASHHGHSHGHGHGHGRSRLYPPSSLPRDMLEERRRTKAMLASMQQRQMFIQPAGHPTLATSSQVDLGRQSPHDAEEDALARDKGEVGRTWLDEI